MKKGIVLLCTIIMVTVSMISVSAESVKKAESFENLESWFTSSANSSYVSLNTESEYIKDGSASLCVTYPVNTNGKEISIAHTDWQSGGLKLPSADTGLNISGIGMWIYGCNDSNIQIFISTRNTNSSAIVKSNPVVLDFSGWKYIKFDVDVTTNYIYGITVKHVERAANTEAKNIYMDSADVIYTYDISQKTELTVNSNITDGAVRVEPDKDLECVFSNPIDSNYMFNVTVEPEADFEINKINDKEFVIDFIEPLAAATQYTVNINGITDVFGQTAEKEISFMTASFKLELSEMESEGTTITDLENASSGEFSVMLAMQSFDTALIGEEVLVFCSVFDENDVMTGIGMKKVLLSDTVSEPKLEMTIGDNAKTAKVFVINSLNNRSIIEKIEIGGVN